ncbi:hypothetical protein PB2503_08699 [Parvularcula bermudensis HTCC2503]|uniref:Purine nucleoside phosphorylase n=1 Tax=Parvularcula bermudensis (strain ATCC BAA-594 / HTCC2503 / KCTC 12087) TaxID=314260 RepID=E0TC02_PARBH|nr:polyphenol oxidase family protein [Parvularcula bermudensis]ADM09795.1 hypothetical protein PB2503_08699 [Parvularcula bermudensis HTCC2503]
MTDPLPFVRSDRLKDRPHGFFGREGGVSTPPFDRLNTGYGSGDREDAVQSNRERVRSALGATALVTLKQTHSAKAVFVPTAPAPDAPVREGDALVSDCPGLAVGVLAADCLPLLLAAPGTGLVAAIHAGWRGSLAGIIGAAIDVMAEKGAVRERIVGAIGPCLRAPAFEAGQDLADLVLAADPKAARHLVPRAVSGKYTYDHVGFALDRLADAGVVTAQIDIVGACTLTHADRWFSYRAAQQAGQAQFGRNMSAIVAGRT